MRRSTVITGQGVERPRSIRQAIVLLVACALSVSACGASGSAPKSARSPTGNGPATRLLANAALLSYLANEPTGRAHVSSSSCLSSASSSGAPARESCTFYLSDGRRYRCSGAASTAAANTGTSVGSIEHDRRCVALARTRYPSWFRALASRLEGTRVCLRDAGLHAGGEATPPVGPANTATAREATSPVGLVALLDRGGSALIVFYRDARAAQQRAQELRRETKPLGAQVERRGAESVVWAHAPAASVRHRVHTCVPA